MKATNQPVATNNTRSGLDATPDYIVATKKYGVTPRRYESENDDYTKQFGET
jgi:hypothetical protein